MNTEAEVLGLVYLELPRAVDSTREDTRRVEGSDTSERGIGTIQENDKLQDEETSFCSLVMTPGNGSTDNSSGETDSS